MSSRKPTSVREFVNQTEEMKVAIKHFKVDWDSFKQDHVVAIPVTKGFIDELEKLFYLNKTRFYENN